MEIIDKEYLCSVNNPESHEISGEEIGAESVDDLRGPEQGVVS